jgi:phosphoglycolate phosphatase-like HAD superfamily hydrolase
MSDAAAALKSLQPKGRFFVGIDSDGCVFDSMEIKHKECFCPNFINDFELQAVSKYAREVWEFVNLYSATRGVNRFKAVLRALDLLRARPETQSRGVEPPRLEGLRRWVERETRLGNPALEAEVEQNPDEDLSHALRWSKDVNETVARIVRGVPPFPYVRESLEKMQESADIVVVSQTPTEALEREWQEHGIDAYARFIAGQEAGTKSEHLQFAAGGKYEENRLLMIGDAPGDLKAARAVDALFFPVLPGDEEASWQRLLEEGLDRFFSGTFAGSYQKELLSGFEKALPETPPWEKR